MMRMVLRRPVPWTFAVCVLAVASLVTAAEKDGAAGSRPGTSETPESSRADTPESLEIIQLKKLLVEQQRQIDELRRMITGQSASVAVKPAVEPPAPVRPSFPKLGEAASTTPMIPSASSVPASQSPKEPVANLASPLQLKIGDTYITPVGFMDFTALFRDTTPGSGIGTNFGSFPYRTQSSVPGNLSEIRLSPQNSRIGARFDAMVKGAKVLAYWESDFLGGVGNPPVGNVAVSTNSYPLRLRLFWVDVKKNKWEILGGQTWSLITPGRNGISPLPADIFYSQVIDVNYMVGMPWGRIPEFRVVYRPNKTVTMAFALDNPEQYIGGSGGGGTSVLPSTLATPYGPELNNGTTTLGVPNMHPDLIAKVAFDGKMSNGNAAHFEVAAIERTFKTYNPLTGQHFTTAGGGFSANLNLELLKGFRFVTNNYLSDGGGRYLFGQAPDLVIRADGSPSLVHSMGTVSGFEYTRKNTLLYAYYGGVYVGRNVVVDTTASKPALVGFGYSGSANSQNKSVQEASFGFNQTIWKDGKYGALNFMGQYAYFSRNPWYIAPSALNHAYMNEIWFNLRYTLPGSAPTLQ